MSWLRSRAEWLAGHEAATYLAGIAFALLVAFFVALFIKRRHKVNQTVCMAPKLNHPMVGGRTRRPLIIKLKLFSSIIVHPNFHL